MLPRLLAGEKLKAVRPLASLNRAQPEVGAPEMVLEPGGEGLVAVRVRLKSTASGTQKDTDGKPRQSGLGQLVAQWPISGSATEPAAGSEDSAAERLAWQKRHEILDSHGQVRDTVIEIARVQLPRRAEQKQVTFTAYAFNEDRVKSATATETIDIPKELRPRQGKAYVITVGVNRTESSSAWDLQYAANDARELNRVVSEQLNRAKQFLPVVPIRLVSDHPAPKGEHRANEIPATKAHLKAVLDMLAGREVQEPLRSHILKLGAIGRAGPEDLILLTVSSHGYTDERGTFHFVLADIGQGQPQRVTERLSKSTLSTDELSTWLREVDAGEMVMVVDACQSEATINTEGFKPGPMGSRGLGQLAYDKGMRVLAASKAKESAFERGRGEQGRDIRQGLLSYALIKEGLEVGEADWQPKDGKITMGEWLAYAEQEVPKLFQAGGAKGSVRRKGAPDGSRDGYLGTNEKTPHPYQQPTLFDFHKGRRETVLR